MAGIAGAGMLRVLDAKSAQTFVSKTGSRLIVPLQAAESLSDAETAAGSAVSSRCSTPALSCTATYSQSVEGVGFRREDPDQEEDDTCQVIVKSTFIDVSDGPTMIQRYRRLRKAKTDSALESSSADSDVYQPGKFSDDVEAEHEAERDSGSGRSCAPETVPEIQVCAPSELPVHTQSQPLAQLRPTPKAKEQTSSKMKSDRHGERTTVMMRNLPNNYTREMFLYMLDNKGFSGRYDLVYLPCDFGRNANLGYAFVNLVDSQAVDTFWEAFDGFSSWALPTTKVCQVSWSGPHQGFMAHVERYRNSPVMHKSVPDEYKPAIFANGVRQPFPSPTKKIKPPNKTGSR